jgi:hypothetical protein
MMNSDFVVRVSKHFANQLLSDPDLNRDEDRIKLAHLRCFAEPPTAAQLDRAKSFIAALSSQQGGVKSGQKPAAQRQAAWTTYCQTLIGSAPFRYLD